MPFAVETQNYAFGHAGTFFSIGAVLGTHPHVSIPGEASLETGVADEVANKRDARLVSLGKKHPLMAIID